MDPKTVLDPTTALDPTTSLVTETVPDALARSFQQAFTQVAVLAPKIVAAVVVLIAGYVIARLLSKTVATLSDKLGVDRAAERGGLKESMRQVGIERTVSQILGAIMFWLMLCVFLTAACNILELTAVSGAMTTVIAYIPKLIVATVVVVLGLLVAQFLKGVIATSADRVGLTYAPQLAAACYWVLASMTFIAAFDQLQIKFPLLNYAILIAFGALALGFGLSFGLGGRDVMAGILAGYYVRQRMQTGDSVDVAGYRGVVREVGPVATVIETEEGGFRNRHTVPNTRMLTEAVR